MSALPERRESKTICRPSGDQRGVPLTVPSKKVNCTAWEPSLSHIPISSLPERSETKTIRLPSGEICGLWSCRVEEINRVGDLWRPSLASARRQILESKKDTL